MGDRKESSMDCRRSLGPAVPPWFRRDRSWDDHPVLSLRQGCSAGSWEGKFRNAALSITYTSSCSRETPCLRGLISILMSCSEAQLGLPTPAGHSHSFTCNYHRTQDAPSPHPEPSPEPGFAQTFRGCSSTQCGVGQPQESGAG